MKYKVVVTDMDGTILKSDHRMSEYTKNVIKQVKDLGVEFIIATGRPYPDAKFFRDLLGLKSYLVTSNGAIAHDEKNINIISHCIDYDLAKEVLDFCKDDKYHRNIYTDNAWYLEKYLEGIEAFHIESGFRCEYRNFDVDKIENINKLFFIAIEEDIKELHKKLEDKFSDRLSITLSNYECLEVMKKGVNKGLTVKELLSRLNLSMSDAISFGDALNDYEMLEMADRGYVMGNAIETLKKKLPNNEIILSCDEDGVAKKLAEIFELNTR